MSHSYALDMLTANGISDSSDTLPSKSLHLVPLKGYHGLGIGLGEYQVTAETPDPASSVGLVHFVQAVNCKLAVFYKFPSFNLKGDISTKIETAFDAIRDTDCIGHKRFLYCIGNQCSRNERNDCLNLN